MNKMPAAVARKVEADAVAWAMSQLKKAAANDWGNMLGSGVPHERARLLLRHMLQSGNGAAAVVEIARGGYDVADELLRECYAEQRERDITPFKCVEAYCLAAIRAGKRKARPGRKRMDHVSRDAVIVATVYGVHKLFAVPITRNRTSSRPSACSVVGKALVDGRFDVPMGERGVEEIWNLMGAGILQSIQFSNVPENPLEIIGMRLG